MERDEVDVERPGSSTPAPRGVDPVTGEREGPRVTPGPLVNCPPSTPGQQHYSLRWNNHQHHLLNAFELLLQNEILVDCTLMCEDAGIRAHRVVLSACSPYFQRLFIDYPGKHPIIVLKDVFFWEMQSILDFMYKGETSVPEAQLTSLIKTAESLKIRGLTSSDQLPPSGTSLSSSPTNLSTGGGYRGYSPSPSPHALHPSHLGGLHHRYSDSKVPHLSSGGSGGLRSTESSPLSLTSHVEQLSDRGTGSRGEDSGRASPVPSQQSNCPRRKQARPRRRSGDSINSSLDLSKPGSPPLSYSGGSHSVDGRDLTSGGRSSKHGDSPTNLHNNHYGSGIMDDTCGPENLSLKRSSSPSPARSSVPPAERGDSRDGVSDRRRHHSPLSHSERSERSGHPPAINLVKMERLVDSRDNSSSRMDMDMSHDLLAKEREDIKHFQNGIKHAHEQEALQALNFMANSSGLPGHMIPPGPGGHHPVLGHPGLHTPPFPPISSPAGGGKGGSSYPGGVSSKPGLEYQRISIDRSKLSEDEAFEHAIDMISTRQMGFRKAADFFQVSKWKLYKTARKRGIYAEIKKQNQAHALSKVPGNVQHFAELGVYKQSRKREDKGDIYPGPPIHRTSNTIRRQEDDHPVPMQYKTFSLTTHEPPQSTIPGVRHHLPLQQPQHHHHSLPPAPHHNNNNNNNVSSSGGMRSSADYPPYGHGHSGHHSGLPHQPPGPPQSHGHHRIIAAASLNNNNNNNSIPLKMSFEKRGDPNGHHIKLESLNRGDGMNGPSSGMMQPIMVRGPLPQMSPPPRGGSEVPPPPHNSRVVHGGQNGHRDGGYGGGYTKYHDEPIQLTKHRYSIDQAEIDDDEDERMLVIAHKEPAKEEVYPAR